MCCMLAILYSCFAPSADCLSMFEHDRCAALKNLCKQPLFLGFLLMTMD